MDFMDFVAQIGDPHQNYLCARTNINNENNGFNRCLKPECRTVIEDLLQIPHPGWAAGNPATGKPACPK